jgi:hypothetical protein
MILIIRFTGKPYSKDGFLLVKITKKAVEYRDNLQMFPQGNSL